MTESPFVYGVELRSPPPTTGPNSQLTQYDRFLKTKSITEQLLLGHHYHYDDAAAAVPTQLPSNMAELSSLMLAGDGENVYTTSHIAAAAVTTNLTSSLGQIRNIMAELSLRGRASAAVVTAAATTTAASSTPTGASSPSATSAGSRGGGGDSTFQNNLIIPLYAVIFLLSVVGNLLVILTLAQNKRMRTVTNVYLLNLAISDLLLGVFCMPFTLVGQVLRKFIFGSIMCKLIPYFQEEELEESGIPESLQQFMKVPLEESLEEFLEKSMEKFLGSHSPKFNTNPVITFNPATVIASTGTGSSVNSSSTAGGGNKLYSCMPPPSSATSPMSETAFHDCRITAPTTVASSCNGGGGGQPPKGATIDGLSTASTMTTMVGAPLTSVDPSVLSMSVAPSFTRHAIRSNYMDKSIEAKKKVIRMLFVIIVEFFVCWAPLHILNTVYLYSPAFVYQYVSSNGIALVQLMAYISSCCNPITYCFMNRRFRQAFLNIFGCYRHRIFLCLCCCFRCGADDDQLDGDSKSAGSRANPNNTAGAGTGANNSDISGNDSLAYAGRSIVQRSGKFPTFCLCRSWFWNPRIVFSTGSDHVTSSVSIVNSISSNRIAHQVTQIIETDPEDETFRFRITWSKSASSTSQPKTATGCDSERYS
ncbi:hypothetical protein RP20_CCG019881 [Aedes albopictus]|nr:hypothetical protein RP20_CCG019881 [Aedes albopictus]